MKHIHTTLIIFLVFFFSHIALAQEKQNDATWEETIEFLSENIMKLDIKQTYSMDFYRFHAYELDGDMFGKKIKFFNYDEYRKTLHFSANPKDLKEASWDIESDNKGIRLTFEGSSVKVKMRYYDGSESDEPGERYDYTFISLCKDFFCKELWYKESEPIIQRKLKAFKHLAYLANEERKKSKF